jgi:aspartate aminotransferase
MSTTTNPAATRTTLASAHLAATGSSAISRMMAAVAKQRSTGSTVIGMHVGEPDFETPANIRAAAVAAIERGDTHYTALDGSPAMKNAVASKYAKAGLSFDHDEIVVGAGAKLLLFAAFFATLEPGDEVIVPAPYWVNYVDIIKMMLAVPVIVETTQEDDFLLRPEVLEAAITERTRWVMFNSPCNPSGAVYQRADYEAVLDVVARHEHVWVLADDMYEHIIYEGTDFVTPLEVRPDLRDRTLTINGVSKAYAMTGWRVGYAVGPRGLMRLVGAVLSQSTSCASSVSQAAAVEALTGPQDAVTEYGKAYAERRGLVLSELAAIPGIQCVPPKGGFYAFVTWNHFHGARTPSGLLLNDDETFCRYLLESFGLATIPGFAFGKSGFARLSFACSSDNIINGLVRLRSALAVLT